VGIQLAEKSSIAAQIKTLASSPTLINQVDKVDYGQVVFEVRGGKVYNVMVTSSIRINEGAVPRTERRKLLSSTGEPDA